MILFKFNIIYIFINKILKIKKIFITVNNLIIKIFILILNFLKLF